MGTTMAAQAHDRDKALDLALAQIDKSKPVIVVCQSGNRSRSGSDILVEAGWSDVRNFKGGTMAWRMRGFELKR